MLDSLICLTAPNVKKASKPKRRVSCLLHFLLFIDGRISLISTPCQRIVQQSLENIRLNITQLSRDAHRVGAWLQDSEY